MTEREEPAEAPSVADGRDHKVHRNRIVVERIGNFIGFAIFAAISFGAVMIVLFAADAMPGWARIAMVSGWLLLMLLLLTRALLWPALSWKYTSYRVTDDLFRFKTGVLFRSWVSVPRSRVQHTDVNQGPIERQFEISTLIVHTAGTEHASVSLSGLEYERALAIRDHLIGSDESDAV